MSYFNYDHYKLIILKEELEADIENNFIEKENDSNDYFSKNKIDKLSNHTKEEKEVIINTAKKLVNDLQNLYDKLNKFDKLLSGDIDFNKFNK